MEGMDRTDLTHGRYMRQALVNAVMNLWIHTKGELLD
jgi:hypothetical protein